MAFYTVFCPDGETPVRVQHESHKAALHAAHQTAKRHPGKRFFVMKSCSKPVTADAELPAEAVS